MLRIDEMIKTERTPIRPAVVLTHEKASREEASATYAVMNPKVDGLRLTYLQVHQKRR
jgi:hypothetical protein